MKSLLKAGRSHLCWSLSLILSTAPMAHAESQTYAHSLERVSDPRPILADYPKYVAEVDELARWRVPTLIDDADADLSVDAWRFSYNARGIIEVPNRLAGAKTAIIVVHPWGIDDGQGWKTPEPAGVAFACTPEKNERMLEHGRDVVNPLLAALRPRVGLVLYSLPGDEDPIRRKLYRSIAGSPTATDRQVGKMELAEKLASFDYRGAGLPASIALASGRPAIDYFAALPGLEAYESMNPKGFWDLPIPVMKPIAVDENDVVIYDRQGYDALAGFLKRSGIEHVLLCGYHADMCVCSTTAGYENLRRDFNVFLVGDAVQASLPGNQTAAHSTNHAVTSASLKVLVTQVSWIHPMDSRPATSGSGR